MSTTTLSDPNEALKAALKGLKILPKKDGGLHQTILNLIYDEGESLKPWSYASLINLAVKKYGKLAALAILVGKYNQQVENGGHYQYFDNNYAGGYSDGFAEEHVMMIGLMEKFLPAIKRIAVKVPEEVLRIMHQFSVVEEVSDDEDGDFCFHIPRYEAGPNNGVLDKAYYRVSTKWMEIFETFLRKELLQ